MDGMMGNAMAAAMSKLSHFDPFMMINHIGMGLSFKIKHAVQIPCKVQCM